MIDPRECSSCGAYFRPRAECDQERCAGCTGIFAGGMTVQASSGRVSGSSVQPQANGAVTDPDLNALLSLYD